MLCPIRIGLGKSSIKAIGNQVQKGELAAWNSEGWCGLSHDILEIDFGQEFDIQLIKVKKVLSSPAPEYVKLGMGSNFSDPIKTHSLGSVLCYKALIDVATHK